MAEPVEPSFRAFVGRTFGDEGRAWLAGLPSIIEELAGRWALRLGPELPGGLLSCVRAATTSNGVAVVLKIGPPWPRTRDEIAALQAWAGRGAPVLLRHDETLGALLLERVEPGLHPDPATAAEVAALTRELHIGAPVDLPPLSEIVRRRIGNALADGRASAHKAAWALAKLEELEAEAPEARLLHGDFDERNLLVCARRGIVAIDPLPCTGDPSYDAAYWVHGNRRSGRRARLDALVALGFDRARVRDWAAVVGVHG